MAISAKEAAEKVGMSKNAIFKAIKSGKLSAEKDIHGEWKIQPAELFRVYEPVNDSSRTTPQPSSREETAQATVSLQRENELLREVVADLRARLDAEAEERRRLSLRLEVETEERLKLAVKLTEERSAPPPAPTPENTPAPQLRSWWARVFGGGE